MTTIKDVAQHAHVSIATVSRYLNNRGYVSKAAREAIEKAIRELNYSPNQLARNLYSSKTNTIGYIVPTISHPFFAEITQYVEEKLYDRGKHMLLCTTVGNQDRESGILDMLRQHRVDGIIVGSHSLDELEYANTDIPIVAFDTLLQCAKVSVSANHQLGGKLVAERVLKSGCRSVLQIIGNPESRTTASLRHQVFFEEMTLAGIPCISIPISRSSDMDISFYPKLADSLLETYPGVDTFFATDVVAMEVVKSALKAGLRVPEDIQVIGYDGTFISSMMYPVITTVCQPLAELAQQIVDSMCALLRGEDVPVNIVLDNLTGKEGSTMRVVD